MSDSLQLHGLQHTRLFCHTLSPGVCSDSYSLSQWCYLITSSSAARFSFCLQSFPESGSFLMSPLFKSGACVLSCFSHLRLFATPWTEVMWTKYWNFNFNISPSNKYSGFTSFETDWFDLLAVQGTLKSLLQQPQFKSINSVALNSLQSTSHIHTWQGKTQLWLYGPLSPKWCLCFLICYLGLS